MPRPIATRVLIAVELLLALLTMSLTWSLLRDPTGNSVGFPANILLVGTPFDDYLLPAMVLFVVAGAAPLFVAVSSFMRLSWAPWGHIAVGVLFTGWSIGQLVLNGLVTNNQLVFVAVGLGLIGLAVFDFIAEARAAREELQAS